MLLNLQQVTCRPSRFLLRTIRVVTDLLPLWHDDPYDERPPLDADCETDVLVIGAGIAGLSCAWHLAERGVDCTVVEARTAASGASGRNGGFLVAGAAPAHQDAVRQFGHEIALGIYRATLDSERRIYEIADAIGASEHFSHVGCLRVTWDPDEQEHARVPVRGDARRRPPGRMGRRGRSAPDRAAAGSRGRLLAARRHDAPGALGAGLLARHRGARRAHLRAQPRPGAARRGEQRRVRRPRRQRHGARAARRRGGGWRAPAARAVLRPERAHQAPAHGGDGARRRAHRALRDRRALGLRVPAAAAGRAHRRGRILRSGRRARSRLLHDESSSRRARSTPASSASCAKTWASRRP